MLEDGKLQFTGTAGVAGSPDNPTTGTQVSNNVVDFGVAVDFGTTDLMIFVAVMTAFTGGTSLQVNVQGSVDNSNWTTMMSGPIVAEAALLVGTYLWNNDLPRIAGPFPDRPGATQALPRYMRLQYVSVGTHGAGAIHGAIVKQRHDYIFYPPGIVIAN